MREKNNQKPEGWRGGGGQGRGLVVGGEGEAGGTEGC